LIVRPFATFSFGEHQRFPFVAALKRKKEKEKTEKF
jgi:hypothetical protein